VFVKKKIRIEIPRKLTFVQFVNGSVAWRARKNKNTFLTKKNVWSSSGFFFARLVDMGPGPGF
jgi:hypothetical protein